MIRQRSPIKRTVAPRKSRGVRKGPWRSIAKRRFIASLPCLICHDPRTQAAHVSHNGMSSKGPDTDIVPACPYHHDEIDGRRKMPNGNGKAEFERVYGVDLSVMATGYHLLWLEKTGKSEPECSCRFAGDQADATGCEAHGVNAERPESPHVVNVRVKGESDVCPF